MKSRTILSVFMGLFVVLFMTIGSSVGASAGLYRQDSLTAALSELEGDVQARDSASGQFAKASNGQSLPVLGQVQTGADGRARLDLSSGTIVRVAPSSLFTFESNEPASSGLLTTLNLEIGKLWVILKGGSLDVNTPSGVAAVQGSYMNVTVTKLANGKIKVTVTCFEGNCNVKTGSSSVDLISGDAAEYEYDPATGTVTDPAIRDMTEAEIQEWVALVDESQDVLDAAFATMTAMAMPPADTSPGPGTNVTVDEGDGKINGSVPPLVASAFGSYASNSQFSLGAAQVSVMDPKAGVVTASLIRLNKFAVSRTGDNRALISHGVNVTMIGSGSVQVCFAYSPVMSDFKVVRWDPSGKTGTLPGSWTNMDTFQQGPSMCAMVPAGVFALAGL